MMSQIRQISAAFHLYSHAVNTTGKPLPCRNSSDNITISRHQPMTIPDFYKTKYQQYHEKTFYIDPSSFLLPFVKQLAPGSRILDVGCGSGRDLLWLSKKGFSPIGFEASAGLAELARSQSNCPVIEGDFKAYDFSSLTVDALLLSGALVHLPHNQVEPALKNILRALKKTTETTLYLSLKEGEGDYTDNHDRTFYLWQEKDIRSLATHLNLAPVHVARTSSVLGTGETWLGFVFKRNFTFSPGTAGSGGSGWQKKDLP
jgi:SAM-dependent methyltransferase